jgi:DDE domain
VASVALDGGCTWSGSAGVDETYVKVRGKWVYLCRAVDRAGNTVDFRLSPRRDVAAAKALEPDGLLNNYGWEAVSDVADFGHDRRLMGTNHRRQAQSVTMPCGCLRRGRPISERRVWAPSSA